MSASSVAATSDTQTDPNASCSNTDPSKPVCVGCIITATGTVKTASRTVKGSISLTSVNGVGCNASTAVPDCTNATANLSATPPILPTWSLNLRNSYGNTAVALFNLATTRRGNPNNQFCTYSGCALEWNVNAPNGTNSIGDQGNAVIIPAGESHLIYQVLNATGFNVAEVGALFPGTSQPSIVGAFWGDTNPAGDPKTVGKDATLTGHTNNGTATSSGTCSPVGTNTFTSEDPSGSADYSSCKNWCYGGDTLVFGVGAQTNNAVSDHLSSVTFNTHSPAIPAQNVTLSSIAKYPNSSIGGAPNDVYSEVWYAHNPNLTDKPDASPPFVVGEKYVIKTVGSTSFTSIGAASNTVGTSFVATGVGSGNGTATPLNPFAFNVSSYKGTGTGAIGARWTGAGNTVSLATSTWTGAGNTASGTTLTVNTTVTGSTIKPGASITNTGGSGSLTANLYITRQLTGTPGGIGTYELSTSQSSVSGGNWTANSYVLTVGTFSGVSGYAYPSQIIVPQITSLQGVLPQIISSGAGDLVTSSGGSGNISNATIASQLTSNETGGMAAGGLGGRGTYSLISTGLSAVLDVSSRTWATTSNILNVSNCSICFIENGDTISSSTPQFIANKTINSQLQAPLLPGDGGSRKAEVLQGVGRYVLNSSGAPALPTTLASATTLRAGTAGTTIYLPSTESMPTVTTPNTRIAIVSGTGAFDANTPTTVTGVTSPVPNAATNSFTVSPVPTTPLSGATICAGTCAFFDQASATTTFTIAKPASTNYWAGGFLCLKGADITPIPVTSSTISIGGWTEVVQ